MTMLIEKERLPVLELPQQITGDVVAYCPGCKAMQTVQVSDNRLMPTRKYLQVGLYIYHDCGTKKPCRLYQNL
jgi:hypothetical protein